MIRPPLTQTIDSLLRAMRNAEIGPDELQAVVLVGGSAQIPLVSELVSVSVPCPVVIDAQSQFAVALGAARVGGALRKTASSNDDEVGTERQAVTSATGSLARPGKIVTGLVAAAMARVARLATRLRMNASRHPAVASLAFLTSVAALIGLLALATPGVLGKFDPASGSANSTAARPTGAGPTAIPSVSPTPSASLSTTSPSTPAGTSPPNTSNTSRGGPPGTGTSQGPGPGAGPPGIRVAASLNCGLGPIGGETRCPDLPIRSVGKAVLHITSLELASSDFSVVDKCIGEHAPGSSCTLTVSFRPQSDGTRTSRLLVHQNLAGPATAVKLSGVGRPADACADGYRWREAFGGDHVCVTADVWAQVQEDNGLAASRVDPNGAYGPDSCVYGYVWREANANDHVCVTGDVRTRTAQENSNPEAHRLFS
jgi:hypothetical protein